jgi:putative acetyltransferase
VGRGVDDDGRPVTVRVETPRQEAVAALLRHSDAVAARLYPNEHRRALNPDTLDAPGVSVLVARTQDGAAAGCCALFDLGGGAGELKRMIVDPAFRQRGVGRALLAAVEATALSQGMAVIRMESGIRNTDGEALYRRAGYREHGPFGAYQASPVSRFFEKVLGAADKISRGP